MLGGIENRKAFRLVAGALLFAQLSYFLTVSALPLYLRDIGTSAARVGLDIGIGSVVALAVTLIVGPQLNRHGARIFLLIGSAVYIVSAAIMLAVPLEGSVVAGRVLQGIGAALIGPSAYAAVPLLAPRRVGSAIGVISTLGSLPLAIGPAVGLALYERGGAPWLFVPAIALGFVALVFAGALALPRPSRDGRRSLTFGYDARWTGPLVANCLQAVYFGAIVAYLPLVLAQAHGPNAGIFFTADAVGVVVLRYPSGLLADRTRPAVPMVLGLAITLLGLAALFPQATVPTLVLAGAGTGIGAGLFSNGLLTQLLNLSSERNRGSSMSLSVASASFGAFLGSASAGLLIEPLGFNGVIAVGGACCIAGLPLAGLSRSGRVQAAEMGK